MIEFLSSWSKSLGLAIIIVSILEMLLPNNKTKKYIRVVMGIYILFCMVSPFIKNKNLFDFNNIDLSEYTSAEISTSVNQTSMDERIQDLYVEQLEKDISNKVQSQGYKVDKCKVVANINYDESSTEISKIKLNVKKDESLKSKDINVSSENKMVSEIQKINPISTSINQQDETESKDKSNISKADVQNIKKFLIDEYEVSENCLEIN